MYISELKLNAVRSYQRASLTFSRGINLLVGKNNSGKSTILRSVYVLQKMNSLNSTDIRKPKKQAWVTITLKNIEPLDCLSFRGANNHLKFDQFSESITITTVYSELSPNANMTYENAENIINATEMGFTTISNNIPQPRRIFPGINDNESDSNFIYPFLSKRKSNSYATRVDLKDIHQVYDDFRFLIAKIKKLINPGHHRNEEFLTLCQEILGFKIGIIPEDHQQENLGIFITDSEIISIQQMGDGVIHIVGLISMLLTEDRKLYIIEELENDLHPQALKSLLELIIAKSSTNQFIISTHSNIVVRYLGSLPETTIFETFFEFEKINPSSKIKIPSSNIIQMENTSEERMSLMEKLGYEPWDFELYKSYLILEESTAEIIIRDFLIPNFVPQLQNRIKTIAASGADDLLPRFHDFLRLFVFIHTNSIYYKKAWVIADGDDAGLNVISELKSKFNDWPTEHFSTFRETNFEYYYPARFRRKAEDVLRISNKKEKRTKKRELINEVLYWINAEPDIAKSEFKISAKEIIEYLIAINSKL